MATKKLFDLTEKTTLADTDKLAGGTSTQNAFNITWAAFRGFLEGIFAKIGGDVTQDFNAKTISATELKEGNVSLISKYAKKEGDILQDFSCKNFNQRGIVYYYNRADVTKRIGIADGRIFKEDTVTGLIDLPLNANSTILAKPNGTLQAVAFIPFTGCHLAEYQGQDFKDFQLVKIKSTGFSSDNQPIWEASFANPNEKGIFGVVYGLNIVPVMEEYEEEELQEVPIEGTDKTEEIQVLVKKTRQIGEVKHWMIASVGDMPMFVCGENGNIEYGDKLTPSSINGVAMKANTNSPVCGIAGQDIIFKSDEIVKIGVTKE